VETRYQGMVLNARTLGAVELARAVERDTRARAYVDREGAPDFIHVVGPSDVQLIYYRASRLAHFHRDPTTGETTVTELVPLPTPLVNVLELDLRAGTPAPLDEEGPVTSCWTVPVADGRCRTCCVGPRRCPTSCRPR
jgi:hypothetical protein